MQHSNHQPVWGSFDEVPTGTADAVRDADVVVVGAGIAGLSTAYNLARAGRRVVVLDSGMLGGRQTHCTTAHLASEIDDRYTEMERLHGPEGAKLAADSHASAIDFIEQTVAREKIDCDFARVDAYLLAGSDEDFKLLEEEEQAARRAGLTVELVRQAPLPGFDTGPALRFLNQGQFHPLRYLHGLARAVTRDRGLLVPDAKMVSVEADGQSAKVELEGGQTITARAVVVATNTPVIDRLAIHTKQAAYLSYVITLPVPPGSVPRALYWDTLDPYHYVRITRGDDGRDLLIVGGEDHKVGQAHDHQERFDRLEAWARQRFPATGPVRHSWSGQILETIDGLAFIGVNPGDAANVFIATGDSGMGMTHGTIAGLLLSDLILGRTNRWADLYSPSRKRVRAVGEYLSENLNTAAQYAAWLTPGEGRSADELKKGCGTVIRQGLHKLAVYRDEGGDLHTCSAVCPHLGAIVTWNDLEKTWDCPAHGSRFKPDGEVIQGPANGDLTPVDQPVSNS